MEVLPGQYSKQVGVVFIPARKTVGTNVVLLHTGRSGREHGILVTT